jgi:hypothetical protein
LSKFRLVIQARRKPSGTYTYVITRSDEPASSKMGAEAFNSPDEAAEAGRVAIARLEASYRSAQAQAANSRATSA